jgi:Fic family protein
MYKRDIKMDEQLTFENVDSQPNFNSKELRFNGSDYEPEFDNERLTGQIKRIYDLMKDKNWRTLGEISDITGDPQASISAQLRHLRKKRFGLHTVNKRNRGDRENGLFEYQLVI